MATKPVVKGINLDSISVIDLNELVRALEGRFGVSAAAMAAPESSATENPEGEANAQFSVVLTESGTNKLSVIRAVREITGLGLKEAKDLVDSAPRSVQTSAAKGEADAAMRRLVEAGASANVVAIGQPVGNRSSAQTRWLASEVRTSSAHTDKSVKGIDELFLERLSAETMGISGSAAALTRVVPITVYLRDGSNATEILGALEAFLESFDLAVFHRSQPILASWFGQLWAKTVDKQTTEEIQKKLAKVEQALETQQIKKPQSEVELNNAQAAAALMNAIGKESKSTVIQVGNLLLLTLVEKNGDKHSRVLTLTPEQCEMIQANQALILDAENLLTQISGPKRLTGT